jgi:hypothetical protein
LTLLLIPTLIWLNYRHGRLDRTTVRHVRVWAGFAAGYWLVWVGEVVLNSVWLIGIYAAGNWLHADTGGDPIVAWAVAAVPLLIVALVTPFTTIAALARLVRALTGDVGQPC